MGSTRKSSRKSFITLIAVAADGYLADEEAQLVLVTLSRMQLFRSYPYDVIGRMFNRLCGILRQQGSEALLKVALASLPYELYETAFVITTDIVLADGEVTQEEETLLNELYRILDIPEKTALKIIDVMMIKNKG